MNNMADTSTPGPLADAQDSAPTGAMVFDPASEPAAVRVTQAAARHLQKALHREQAAAVRLGVTESGCNGYMYELSYAEIVHSDDHHYPVTDTDGNSLLLVVAPADLALVAGTEIDYVTEGLNSALRFKNPNAETHCGCGESFSVAEPDPQHA